MKIKSKILFPIVALVGLIPCITSCYTEPSYKVIGSAKITRFCVDEAGNKGNEDTRTSLIMGTSRQDNNILGDSVAYTDERIDTMPTPSNFDKYLNYLFKVTMSIEFDISTLDQATADWVRAGSFNNSNLDLSRFHFTTLTYKEMNNETPKPPQAGQATYFPTYSNYLAPNVSSTQQLRIDTVTVSGSTVKWDIDMITCLGQIYGLKLDPSGQNKYIHTDPYTNFKNLTNIQNQLRLNDAYNSYISTPNGNRFDFTVDDSALNIFFTFVGQGT